jgi:hypothetical protein
MQRLSIGLGILLLVLASCSSVSVKYDYDKATDFHTYKTYAWSAREIPHDALAQNPLMKKRVRLAVDETLGAMGYSLTEQDQADFVVVIHAGVKERMRVQDYGRYGWYDPWWGPWGGRVEVSYYEEGTLVIDVVDAEKKELVWRGMGTGIVRKYAKPEKMQKDIDEDVTKILANFPPERGRGGP